MRYMQIKGGQKLHLVYEAGEGISRDKLIRRGYLGFPICGKRANNKEYDQGFRMTINLPLAHACMNCQRIYNARHGRGS